MDDPYELLGVPRDATDSEIKSAFRRQAARYHPDLNPSDPGAGDRFKAINQAAQILSDPQKRAAFDRFGAAAFERGGTPGSPAGGGFSAEFDLKNLDAVFGDLLGAFGVRGGRGSMKLSVQLTFEQAALGHKKELRYERTGPCKPCGGDGARPGTTLADCQSCGGSGRARSQRGLLPFTLERECAACHGRGKEPHTRCTSCSGSGLRKQTRIIEVDLPAGIEDGTIHTVEAGGNQTRPGKSPGNLELKVRVSAHEFFERDGDDLNCRLPISFAQATLGGQVVVPTLTGKAKLRIPPATQSGSILRLRGKGLPRRLRGGHGDQFVEVGVTIPGELSNRARELVTELAGELGEDLEPQEKTLKDRLKGLFN